VTVRAQVTFLHLFHHSSITFVVGSIVSFDYSGDMFLPILLNSIVHVLMYSHYLVTALGIKSWWRKHLTSLQLGQFVLISMQSYISWTSGPECGAPDWAKILMIAYMVSMLLLFGNFFFHRYVWPPCPLSLDIRIVCILTWGGTRDPSGRRCLDLRKPTCAA
jgi:hypothetical protein